MVLLLLLVVFFFVCWKLVFVGFLENIYVFVNCLVRWVRIIWVWSGIEDLLDIWFLRLMYGGNCCIELIIGILYGG